MQTQVYNFIYIYVCRQVTCVFHLVPSSTLSKMENAAPSVSTQSDHSPSEHNGFTMSSSSSHDAGSPPPESNGSAMPNMDRNKKKKLSLGGSFSKFWKGNKKVKDNGMI